MGAACLLFAASAVAQSPPAPPAEAPDVVAAREAYKLGASLVVQEQWTDALAAFVRSSRLKPHGVTTFNVGYCERALGRLTRARKSFLSALAAPELPDDKAVEARRYLAEIEGRLSRASTTLTPPGAAVSVDGRPLDPAGVAALPELVAGTRDAGQPEVVSAAKFTLVLDPGTHVIVVSVPGRPDAVVTRDFGRGETTTLALAAGAPPAAAPVALAQRAPAGRSARRVGAAVAFGVGGAAAVVGAVAGALALKDKDDLDGVCPQKASCPVGEQGTINAMKALATVTNVAVPVAVAGVGVGAALLLWDDRRGPASGAALTFTVGPGTAGLRGSF
jgi:hypothetical protein